jgi:iron complex transport system substrate-binding protein
VHLSDENLDLLDADLTLILPIYVDASEASSNKLFQKVPSVEAGHSIVFDDKDVSSAFSMGTTAAIEWALDKLPAEFEKKLG